MTEEEGKDQGGKFSHAEYYNRNKRKLSARRKKRYVEDPLFREQQRSYSRRYYKLHVKKEKPINRKVIADDQGNRYVTIGKLSTLIKRGIQTIRRYHTNGIIPVPSAFDSRGWRLYSREQAVLLMAAFKALDDQEDRRITSLEDLKKFLEEKWDGDKKE